MKRALSGREAMLWNRVASTVTPLDPARQRKAIDGPAVLSDEPRPPASRPPARRDPPQSPSAPPPQEDRRPRTLTQTTLDAGWDRKLARGVVHPDFTLDLHGCTLDAAHARLDHGLALALAQGARVVLLITGRPRPQDDHGHAGSSGRGERRGAIRAKFLDWLAGGSHASRIAAIRAAHPRHGGSGAVYIVLRRAR